MRPSLKINQRVNKPDLWLGKPCGYRVRQKSIPHVLNGANGSAFFIFIRSFQLCGEAEVSRLTFLHLRRFWVPPLTVQLLLHRKAWAAWTPQQLYNILLFDPNLRLLCGCDFNVFLPHLVYISNSMNSSYTYTWTVLNHTMFPKLHLSILVSGNSHHSPNIAPSPQWPLRWWWWWYWWYQL